MSDDYETIMSMVKYNTFWDYFNVQYNVLNLGSDWKFVFCDFLPDVEDMDICIGSNGCLDLSNVNVVFESQPFQLQYVNDGDNGFILCTDDELSIDVPNNIKCGYLNLDDYEWYTSSDYTEGLSYDDDDILIDRTYGLKGYHQLFGGLDNIVLEYVYVINGTYYKSRSYNYSEEIYEYYDEITVDSETYYYDVIEHKYYYRGAETTVFDDPFKYISEDGEYMIKGGFVIKQTPLDSGSKFVLCYFRWSSPKMVSGDITILENTILVNNRRCNL